jgi:hypothetical protein
MERRRGKKLTFLILIFMILNLATSYRTYEFALDYDSYNIDIPQIVFYIVATLALLNAAFLGSILLWKKWGVYGFIVNAVIAFVINVTFVTTSPIIFLGLLGPVFVFWLIKPIWQDFD